MLDKLDAVLRFQQETLNLRVQRQEVLATNIVNANTPGYQVRDIDFASELRKVIQHGRNATSVAALTMTSTQYIPVQALTPPTAELQYRIPDQPSLDGNTVDMDRKRIQFADNGLQYQMSLSMLSGQIKGMMSVLQSGDQRTVLLNIFDIAGSALTARSQRLNVAVSNLANADSMTGPGGQPYRIKQMVFQVSTAPGAVTGNVRVANAVENQTPDKLVYEPGSPLADARGCVKMPNVDVVGKIINTMSASRSYQTDVEVLNVVKSMMLKTLTLGQ